MNTISGYMWNSCNALHSPYVTTADGKQDKGALLSNKRTQDIRRMLSDMRQDSQNAFLQKTDTGSILCSSQSYGDTLRMQREQAKDTSLKLKKLKYQFKNISSRILRSKTSATARQVAGQAKREVLRLKREKQNGSYDSEEIDAAITHAKAMERVARKKVRHLEQEEMAKVSGDLCGTGMIEEEESREVPDEKSEEATEDALCKAPDQNQVLQDTLYEFSDEAFSTKYAHSTMAFEKVDEMLSDVEELSAEMLEQLSEGMKEMLEEMGLGDLSDAFLGVKGDMDPEDLKSMKIKHRNKEMKDIVKADAEYLKAVFDHLEKTKDGGITSAGIAGAALTGALPASSPIGICGSVTEPVINITL